MGHVLFNNDRNHRKGVGIVLTEKLSISVINVLPFSDRIKLLKLYAKPVNVNVTQVYAPTTVSTEDEIETFHEELKQVLKQVKNHEINVIMGDFNAKVGEGRFEALVGPYELELRNDRGKRLSQFCQ